MRPDAGRLVYGTITVGGVLAAESALRETYGRTLGGAAVALILYWLAHTYAELTHRRVKDARALGREDLVEILIGEAWILPGAAAPILVVTIADALGASLADAITAAVWFTAGLVVTIEVVLGLRERLAPRELALQSGFGLALGLLVVSLRAVLH
jgi:hypothetical protein